MRISDWSSDVCSSDLARLMPLVQQQRLDGGRPGPFGAWIEPGEARADGVGGDQHALAAHRRGQCQRLAPRPGAKVDHGQDRKSVVQGKRVSVRVNLGGRRTIKKKKIKEKNKHE